ncbi:MAG: aspartyl/asparaginyl beta-hydroxylase domain-containing protein [Dehalococcoidia bacterium]
MVSMIAPEGHIHLHTDSEADAAGAQRLHLVLKTNPSCWSYSADAGWQQLEEGGIYTFDPTIEHASINLGSEPRLHFVVDLKGVAA